MKRKLQLSHKHSSQNSKHLTKVTLHLCVSSLRLSDFLNTFSSAEKPPECVLFDAHHTSGHCERSVFALSLPHLEKIKTNENQHFISDVIAGNEALL